MNTEDINARIEAHLDLEINKFLTEFIVTQDIAPALIHAARIGFYAGFKSGVTTMHNIAPHTK